LAEGFFDGRHLETFHRGLKGIDGIELGDNYAYAKTAEWAEPLPTSPMFSRFSRYPNCEFTMYTLQSSNGEAP
jgi:hypothetical protein